MKHSLTSVFRKKTSHLLCFIWSLVNLIVVPFLLIISSKHLQFLFLSDLHSLQHSSVMLIFLLIWGIAFSSLFLSNIKIPPFWQLPSHIPCSNLKQDSWVVYYIAIQYLFCNFYTGLIKNVPAHYMAHGYDTCLLDASKAFDMVEHSLLFQQLAVQWTIHVWEL